MSNIITSIQFKRGEKLALEAVLVGANKPLKGEPVWESDTNKLKIGDGINNYANLPYISGGSEVDSPLVLKGYYYANIFWEEEEHLNPLTRYVSKLYIDIPTSDIYYYATDTNYYKLVGVAQVGSNVPGLVKLYAGKGNNVDGAMTQGATTTELNKKVEMSLEEIANECLILGTDLN